MNQKILTLALFIFLSFLAFPQNADDIIVPAGYKVEKIAETNPAADCCHLIDNPSGEGMICLGSFSIYQLDNQGNVELIGFTRRFGLSPDQIVISPTGDYIVSCFYSAVYEQDQVSRFTPPDNFQTLLVLDRIYSIAYDKDGRFFVNFYDNNTNQFKLARYNSLFQQVDIINIGFASWDMVFDNQNNLYLAQMYSGNIWRIPAGTNSIPGSEDPPELMISGLNTLASITMDDSNNIYAAEFTHNEIDGFSLFDKYRIIKVNTTTNTILDVVAADLYDPAALHFKDGFLYICEFSRAVVSRVDLTSHIKDDFTADYGIAGVGTVAFDQNDNLYVSSFRGQKLYRLSNNGTYDQVGAGIGITQSIANDGQHFYMGSYDTTMQNGQQIIRVDPIAETMEVVGTHYNAYRSVAFDSYGRLILNSTVNYSQNLYAADIIDTNTGAVTPYVTGLHNKARCIQFDNSQNLYFVEGIGDGIKKVSLDMNYDPPRDLSTEPLFYDFSNEPYPPTIYFFCVNALEEVFIPLMDTGVIRLGDKQGNVNDLAKGFTSPNQVSFDKYGTLYVSDFNKGLFKITHIHWTLPYIISVKDQMIQDIKDSNIHPGIKNSLVKKLENADNSLDKGNLKTAIKQIIAFCNEIEAQKGKAIPIELANTWLNTANNIINALEDLIG
jgi:hypothetical protein